MYILYDTIHGTSHNTHVPTVLSLLLWAWDVTFSSVENLQAVIGCWGSRDVFVVMGKFNSEMQEMFCGRIPPSFPCGSTIV